jgi:hypothetical protein
MAAAAPEGEGAARLARLGAACAACFGGGREPSVEDFRAVLQTIVSSPHAAVPVLQMYAELGDDGAAKLESMNAKNLLLRRAYDPLARDIDTAAFGPDLEDVYTLPSAAHVLAARRKLKL